MAGPPRGGWSEELRFAVRACLKGERMVDLFKAAAILGIASPLLLRRTRAGEIVAVMASDGSQAFRLSDVLRLKTRLANQVAAMQERVAEGERLEAEISGDGAIYVVTESVQDMYDGDPQVAGVYLDADQAKAHARSFHDKAQAHLDSLHETLMLSGGEIPDYIDQIADHKVLPIRLSERVPDGSDCDIISLARRKILHLRTR